LEDKLEEQRSELDHKRKENEALGQEIEQLKLQIASEPDFLSKQRLDRLLSKQRDLSIEISMLEAQIASGERKLRQINQELRGVYTEELNKLALAIDGEQDRGRKAELINNYLSLRYAKSRVSSGGSIVEPSPSVPMELTIDPLDTIDDLLEKAAILRDSERRIRQRIRRIKELIAELEQDKMMDQQMWETIEREQFFEDGGVLGPRAPLQPPRLEEYDRQIAELQTELRRLESIASELVARARGFEQEAARRRGEGGPR